MSLGFAYTTANSTSDVVMLKSKRHRARVQSLFMAKVDEDAGQ